jgi:hypothetical protein
MAENVSDLVTEIIAQGAIDAATTDVLKWLNRRHKEMVVRARGYRKTLTVGTTVAGTQAYNVPAGVVEITDITVAGMSWGKGRLTDIAADANGWLWLDGDGGVIVQSASSGAVSQIALVPAPSTGGDTISAPNAAVMPPDLLIDNTVPLVIDDDFVEGLLAGVFATALNRPNEARSDLAATQQAIFENAVSEYSRRVKRRLRGAGPTSIRVGLPGGVTVG